MIIKRNLFPVIYILLLGLGCDNDDSGLPVIAACDVENPIKNLEWLTTEVTKRKNDTSPDAIYCFIEQAIVDNQTIFIYNDCNPLINKIIPIYDCRGNSIGFLGDENFIISTFMNRTIIFQPSDFACQLD